MADSMVTARMSSEKKELGNQILAQLGTNASQTVNELYDYVISHKRLPFSQNKEFGLNKYSKKQIQDAARMVDSLVIQDIDPSVAVLSTKEAKRLRLKSELEGGGEL